MNEETQVVNKPPTLFYLIAGGAAVWDLLGVGAFVATITAGPDAFAGMPEARREFYENVPAWSTIIFGIAVSGGMIGSILLLARKLIALPVLVISLAAVAVNVGYTYLMTNALEVLPRSQLVMDIIIFGIAAFLVWFANDAKNKGWLR
jgi:hypothetical protein